MIFTDVSTVHTIVQGLGGIDAVAVRLGLPSNAVEHFLSEANILPLWVLDELFAAWKEEMAAVQDEETGTS